MMNKSVVQINNNANAVVVVRSDGKGSAVDQRRSPADPLMSDWDDDNVIVIDLTEERLLNSASTQSQDFDSEQQIEDEREDTLESSFISNDVSLIEENVVTATTTLNNSDDLGLNGTEDVPHSAGTVTSVTSDRASSAESSSSSGSARSQANTRDSDFHCKDFEARNVAGNVKNGGTRRHIFKSGSIDRTSSSKTSKTASVDQNDTRNGSPQLDVLTRLHREIYDNTKMLKNGHNGNNSNHVESEKNETSPEKIRDVKLAPVKVRPWEKKILKSEFLGGREVTYIKPRKNQLFKDLDNKSGSPDTVTSAGNRCDSESGTTTTTTPMSADNIHKAIGYRPSSRSLSSSRDGIGSAPLSVFTGSRERSAPEEPFIRRSLERSAQPSLIYRGVLAHRQPTAAGENRDFVFSTFKARSSDFLDRMDNSVSSRGRTRSSVAVPPPTRSGHGIDRDKMTRIDKNLFLGSIEAATDVILLESNAITHIVSVDSVPLPRKISSTLPRISFMHMQVSDLPDEDLLSHLGEVIAFIDSAISRGGSVLVHCFRGRSRSASVVIAYMMYKHHYKLEKAFAKVRSKRDCINPHVGFMAQLKLFESMEFTIDPNNVQYKMFRLFCASERMRKAKILFRDSLDKVLDVDPAGGLPGSAEAAASAASKSRYPMIYKCKKCRRTLATAFNMLPHVRGESPNWMDEKWARLNEEDVLDDASSPAGLNLCNQSVFVAPVGWMEHEIKQNLSGRLYCPNCQVRVGNYSWILGDLCKGCGANVLPAFQLDMTEIIFRTHNRYLQSGYLARGPILV